MRAAAVCLLLLTSLAPVLVAQEEESGGAPTPIPAAVKAKLSGILLGGKAEGVPTSGAPQFYSSNLFEYMDGGADIYLTYGLVALAHQEYKLDAVDMTVDVFDMGHPLKAFGIYSVERSPKYNFMAIGAEGYASEMTLNFLQDRYYVKLSAFGDQGPQALETFARSISGRIGANHSLPGLIGILPVENRVAHSEKYLIKAPAGHEFLTPAMTAAYRVGSKETSLLISVAPDAREAASRVDKLRTHYLRFGKVDAAPEIAPGAWRTSDARQGNVVFFASGRYAVLCFQAPDQAATFLKDVASHLAAPAAPHR